MDDPDLRCSPGPCGMDGSEEWIRPWRPVKGRRIFSSPADAILAYARGRRRSAASMSFDFQALPELTPEAVEEAKRACGRFRIPISAVYFLNVDPGAMEPGQGAPFCTACFEKIRGFNGYAFWRSVLKSRGIPPEQGGPSSVAGMLWAAEGRGSAEDLSFLVESAKACIEIAGQREARSICKSLRIHASGRTGFFCNSASPYYKFFSQD